VDWKGAPVTPLRGDGANGLFAHYANFYDALYADKDYEAECDFLVRMLGEHGVGAGASILDLGSGTGNHDIPLARRGFAVTGVDRSAEMVGLAREKAAKAGRAVDFVVGDVRDAEIGRTFDAVVSLFAVVCYQLTNDDLARMFANVRRHLESGGIFVFDGWFGPGVLSDRPTVRTKVVTDASGDVITRVASPTLDVLAQTVEVAYEVRRESDGVVVEEASEAHPMRFLFAQEITLLLELSGLELVAFGPFMDVGRPIAACDWNFTAVARAV
jgi:SAM-dependent methyltransferase